MNNADFVERLRARDPAAAQHLSECFVPPLWRFVLARLRGDQHLAEDIVSETVLALVGALENEVAIEYPSAWLRAVATKKMTDHFRAAARVEHLLEQSARMCDEHKEETPVQIHDRKLNCKEIRDALDRMPEDYRLALEWKYLDRDSVRDIADRFGTTEKGAESMLFRARKRFRLEVGIGESKHQAAPKLASDDPTTTFSTDQEPPNPSLPNEMLRSRS